MHIQTCSQCGAKNQIDEGAGPGRKHVCYQCGAEVPTVGGSQDEEPWPVRNSSGSAGRLLNSEEVQSFKDAVCSYVLIAINVIVFILMVSSGVHFFEPTVESLYKWGADFGPASLGAEPWRLLSCMFVHVGIIHLALNMYVLSDIGSLNERLYGKRGFLVLYLLSGIGGSIASACWNPSIVSAGASGAVFGLFGGLLGLLVTQRSAFPSDFVQQHMTSILGFLAFNIIYGMSRPGIDNAAHMGGLVTGFIIALLLKPNLTGQRKWGLRQFAGLALVLLALGLTGFATRQRVEGSSEARFRSIIYSSPKVTAQPGKEIYFFNGATEEEARRLGQNLQERGSLKEVGEIIILLSKGPQGFEVSYSLRPDAFSDPKLLKMYEVEATDISVDVFNKTPVAIHLGDEFFTPKLTAQSGSKITLESNKEIHFRDEVTEGEARGLGQALQQRKYLEGADGAHIELLKDSQGYEVLFVVKDGTWNDPLVIEWYRRLATNLSADLFNNKPVAIHLYNKELEPKRLITD